MSPTLHTTPRLFVGPDLGAEQTITVTPDQAHYLQHVLRMQGGERLRLFNGRDGEWTAKLSAVSKKSVEIEVREQTREQTPAPDLWLCCSPIKKTHFDFMIEKATELGSSEIHAVLTARTHVREINVDRVHALTVEAAEQSERLDVPVIHKAAALKELINNWPADRRLIVCAEWGDAEPVRTAFEKMRGTKKVAVLTGPEGGFAAEELEMLRTIKDVVFVRLGPRILRADTAAIAALSCWQAVCGDWK